MTGSLTFVEYSFATSEVVCQKIDLTILAGGGSHRLEATLTHRKSGRPLLSGRRVNLQHLGILYFQRLMITLAVENIGSVEFSVMPRRTGATFHHPVTSFSVTMDVVAGDDCPNTESRQMRLDCNIGVDCYSSG